MSNLLEILHDLFSLPRKRGSGCNELKVAGGSLIASEVTVERKGRWMRRRTHGGGSVLMVALGRGRCAHVL